MRIVGRRSAEWFGGRLAPRHEIDPTLRPGASTPGRKRLIDYPRAGRSGWKRWIPSWRLVLGLGTGGFAAMVLAAIALYAAIPVPDPVGTFKQQTTFVYYADGKPLGQFSAENRTNVPLSKVPKAVRYAVLSAEDRTFYDNAGVSLTGIVRAAWRNTQSGAVQGGGSTLTQQYVKIVLLGDQSRTVQRKVKEFVIALKINKEMDKDTILENYLNGIFFGRRAWGIQAASRTYFGKDVDKLNASEGALLAGILNSPSGYYDPANGPEALARIKARWTYIADGMLSQGWITAEERAAMKFPTNILPIRPLGQSKPNDQTGYLLQMVHDEMVDKRGFTETQLYSGGLRIYTTFKRDAMDAVVKAVDTRLKARATWPKGTQVAIASIDPTSGAVVAIYGGDGVTRKQNAATQDIVQAGSTFKPFTLAAALEGGQRGGSGADSPTEIPTIDGTPAVGEIPLSLRSRFDGSSPQTIGGQQVKNFGGTDYPMIDLVTATENSVNTVYVRLNHEIGPDRTRDAARRAGIPESTKISDNVGNVLGDASPHPIDMAAAYATFAAQGTRHDWFVVREVKGPNDGKIPIAKSKSERVFDEGVMADVTYAMRQVVRSGSGAYAGGNLGREAAGKTGTSTDSKSAWFVGFTPQLSTAVALYRIGADGTPQSLQGFAGVSTARMTGGGLPVRVWTDYMSRVLKGQEELDFPDPVFDGAEVNPVPSVTTSSPTTPATSSLPTTTFTTPPPIPTTTPTVPTPTLTTPTFPTTTRTLPPQPTITTRRASP